jgi:hypothetical protein
MIAFTDTLLSPLPNAVLLRARYGCERHSDGAVPVSEPYDHPGANRGGLLAYGYGARCRPQLPGHVPGPDVPDGGHSGLHRQT